MALYRLAGAIVADDESQGRMKLNSLTPDIVERTHAFQGTRSVFVGGATGSPYPKMESLSILAKDVSVRYLIACRDGSGH